MAKPDPALLSPARYPFHCEIELRVSDLDVNQHVNNVALVEIFQEGRSRYFRASGGRAHLEGVSLMVASLAVEFLGECHYGEDIVCHSGLISLGRTSQSLSQLIVQGGAIVAYAEIVMVSMVDGKPTPHSAEFRAAMQDWIIEK